MIAVSLGQDGAILCTNEGVCRLPAVKVETCTAVGAGDSFLAGLVLGLARGLPHREALALGISAGAATVIAYGTAQVRRTEVESLYRNICGGPEPIIAPET